MAQTVATITEDFESNSLSGGSGWDGDWVRSNSTRATFPTTAPQAGSRHLRIAGSGTTTMTREIDLSAATDATLSYYVRRNSNFSGSDELRVQVSPDNSTWTSMQVHRISNSNMTTSYVKYDLDLASYLSGALIGDSSVYIRFEGSMNNTADEAYVDTVSITRTVSAVSVHPHRRPQRPDRCRPHLLRPAQQQLRHRRHLDECLRVAMAPPGRRCAPTPALP